MTGGIGSSRTPSVAASLGKLGCVHHGRSALILNRIGKGSCETHGKRPRI
jgi:hypothetical protein